MGIYDTSIYVFWKEVSSYAPLTREEEEQLFPRYRAGDLQARDRIVEGSLHIVFKIARSYSEIGMTFSDLVQEGNVGLLDALEKFDVDRGYRFSTYASFWIKQAIQTAIHRNSNLVRLPYRKVRLMGHITEALNNFVLLEGREPTVKELASFLDISVKVLQKMLELREPMLSLNQTIGLDSRTLSDVVADDKQNDPVEAILNRQRQSRIRRVLNFLTVRERQVICWRYGLMDHPPLSLRKISKKIGLSQEGVRRIEIRALRKLRRPAIMEKVGDLI
ncbi:MAG: RNA polymerase sigma factor RpoD [Candidatus Sumerlaeia bacterium]